MLPPASTTTLQKKTEGHARRASVKRTGVYALQYVDDDDELDGGGPCHHGAVVNSVAHIGEFFLNISLQISFFRFRFCLVCN